jgi:hypothetical protein
MLKMTDANAIITNYAEGAGERDPKVLAHLERELELVGQALSLLGLRRCSQCGKFYRASDAGALFDGGEWVCRDCIEQWWPHCLEELRVRDREVLERRLVNWLVSYHGGKVLQRALPDAEKAAAFCLTTNCVCCDGSGTAGGERCGACEGGGTVWVVVPRQSEGSE